MGIRNSYALTEPEILKRRMEVSQQFYARLKVRIHPVVKAFQTVGEVALGAGQVIQNAFYQAYLKIGAPYGENQEGFGRWLAEIAEQIPNDEAKMDSVEA